MVLALLGPLGFQELVLILVIVVFLFGARKIPEVARGLGEGIRGFRTSLRAGDEGNDADDDDGRDKPDGSKEPPKD